MAMLFSHEYRRRTLLNSLFLFVSISGLWAGSVYVPSAVSFLSSRDGLNALEATRMASWATVILSVATIFGSEGRLFGWMNLVLSSNSVALLRQNPDNASLTG
jgi:hypothetical protein